MTALASPWDVLLKAPPMRVAPAVRHPDGPAPGTKTDLLLSILRGHASLPTLALAVRADLTPRQVWGLLKAPRAAGEVVFDGGRWAVVPDFPGRAVQRAAELLRSRGWMVEPPEAS